MKSVVTHDGGNFELARVDSGARSVQLDRVIKVLAGETESVLTAPGTVRCFVARNFAASSEDAAVKVILDPATPDLSAIEVDDDDFIQVDGGDYILLEAGEGTAVILRPQKGVSIPLWPEVEEILLTNLGDEDAEIRLVVF
jgi:hypothetical protein